MKANTVENSNQQIEKKSSILSRFRGYSRPAHNFVLIWLDVNITDASDDDHHPSINQVRSIINDVNIFNDAYQCMNYLKQIKHEKAFMIVSGSLGEQVVPHIHDIAKLESIYVFCGRPDRHEHWIKNWSKIKGIYTQIAPICDSLKQTIQKNASNLNTLSFVKPIHDHEQNLDRLDQSFMYTQVLKEILLEIEYSPQSFQDLIEYCRKEYANNAKELIIIKQFEDNYQKHSPIYWYTHPGFIYSTLNRALRMLDIDTIIKMGFFIQDLCKAIEKVHNKQTDGQAKQSFIVYRGQSLSKDDFDQLVKAKNGLISFNNFLSTSKKRDVSIEFAKDALENCSDNENVGIVFKMVIDPSELATPYAFIDDESYFENEEEEVLFSMHTVFRIGEIKQITKTNNLYQVILTLINSKNKQLSELTELLRYETQGTTGWHRLGMLLIKLGKFNKAEQVYKILSELNHDENEKALVYHQIGLIKRHQGDYKEALNSYNQALNIYKQIRSSDDLDLAATYNNLGQVHFNMSDDSKALSYYEQAIDIFQKKLTENHPSLASVYNNIGLIYKYQGNYKQALQSHEKALSIEIQSLPNNHPSLATSYKNLGLVYKNMGDYTKALSYFEDALTIEQNSLPSNHPSLAISFNNIGLIYDHMREYSQALSFYEKTLEIYQETLSPNHPDFALCFNNIGSVYTNLGEYAKALSFYKRTLEIEQTSLSEDHSSLAITHNNIGLIYNNRGEYSQAIASYEKALDICKKTLSLQHPLIAILYSNMGSVHDNQGHFEQALQCYIETLNIEEKIFPEDHPDLATSYNNIGLIYHKLGQFIQAISYHEKALNIYQQRLPINHPDLVNSFNNLGLAYQQMNDYSKALIFYEKALEICQKNLPTDYQDLITCYANISQLYGLMGEHSKALEFFDCITRSQQQIPTKHDPNVTSTDEHIDEIYEKNKKSSEIMTTSKAAIEIMQQAPLQKQYRSTTFRIKREKKCPKKQ